MAYVESQVRQHVTPMPEADPRSTPATSDAPVVVGYAASIAMAALATAVAVGIDRGVTIPNLSLIFVVPVIIAGVGFGLGPSFFSAVLGALATRLERKQQPIAAPISATRHRPCGA